MNYETMMIEMANHKQKIPKDEITYFAKMATIPDNFDTIICYLEQDEPNAVLYTKNMFTYLAHQDGVNLPIHTSMINAIIDIFKHYIIVEVTLETDIANVLLQLNDEKTEEVVKESITEEVKEVITEEIVKEVITEEVKESVKEIDHDITEKTRLIKRQLKRTKKRANKQYIKRAAEIYDEIEEYVLKCRPIKKIHKLFGKEFPKKNEMDTIISAIKQIVTYCDDDSEPEQEPASTISEQVGNHINGFTLDRNIVAPISDISYAVKQQFVISSINNINTVESYTVDNQFMERYVNPMLRNLRNKCIAQIS